MYIHLGNETVVEKKDIIGIFDLDTATVSRHTRKYINLSAKNDDIVYVTNELPKSFVVCAKKNSKNRKNEDINKRLQIINKENVILYISIHCNMYFDSSIKGAQTFYNSKNEENEKLAYSIQSKIKSILKNTNREIKSITGKYLVDNAQTTGALVELGFLSNNTEFNLLNTNHYQEKIAYCIYIGIIDYLG